LFPISRRPHTAATEELDLSNLGRMVSDLQANRRQGDTQAAFCLRLSRS